MDAYLLKEAYQSLRAFGIIATKSISDGLLSGHIRGHRFIVEKIFPTQRGFFPSLDNYFSLNQIFDDEILGFFSFFPEKKKMKKILAPFAFGKLILQIHLNRQNKMVIKSFLIDYDKEFYLSPIRLIHSNLNYF